MTLNLQALTIDTNKTTPYHPFTGDPKSCPQWNALFKSRARILGYLDLLNGKNSITVLDQNQLLDLTTNTDEIHMHNLNERS